MEQRIEMRHITLPCVKPAGKPPERAKFFFYAQLKMADVCIFQYLEQPITFSSSQRVKLLKELNISN